MNVYDVLRLLVERQGDVRQNYLEPAEIQEAVKAIEEAEAMGVFGSAAYLADTGRTA